MRRCGTQVDPPAAELDEREDVEGPEPGGLDAEEVTGNDPARLRPQELRPAWARAPRRRTEARSPEQGPDRRRSHPDAELAQLALDPFSLNRTDFGGASPSDPVRFKAMDKSLIGAALFVMIQVAIAVVLTFLDSSGKHHRDDSPERQ